MKNNPSLVLSRFVNKIDLSNYRVSEIANRYTFKELFFAGMARTLFNRRKNERIEFVFVNALNGTIAYTLINGRSTPNAINRKNIKYLYKAKKLSREQ